MFLCQMLQAGPSRPLLHCTPFDRAAPQLAQLQMARYHVGVQGRVHSGITDATKSRPTVASRRRHSTFDARRRKVLNTAFGQRRHNEVMSAGESCDDLQVGEVVRFSMITSWKPSIPNLASGSISRSSQGVDPGSIRETGLSASKARRPNTSGEMDKSKSITPSEYMFICSDPFSSWDHRILLACS